MPPTAKGVIGGLAEGVAVPPFHWMDAPAVADDEAPDIQVLGQGRSFHRGKGARFAREVQAQLAQMIDQTLATLEVPDFGITILRHGGYRIVSEDKTQDELEVSGVDYGENLSKALENPWKIRGFWHYGVEVAPNFASFYALPAGLVRRHRGGGNQPLHRFSRLQHL